MSAAELPHLALVHRPSGDPQQSQALGPYRIEPLLTEAEEGAGTAYRVRIEPQQRTAVSYHKKAEEFYFVVAGRGTALLDGREYALRPGDSVIAGLQNQNAVTSKLRQFRCAQRAGNSRSNNNHVIVMSH